MIDPKNPESVAASQADLLGLLADGATVGTGNARLARSLSGAYERDMLDRGRTAWATPAVLPWTAWMQDGYEEASLASATVLPRLLAEEQEAMLWAAVIRDDLAERGTALLRVDAAAQRARRSRQLLLEYRIALDDRRFGYSENADSFRRWVRRFEARCRKLGTATMADLPALLEPLLRERLCPVPGRLVLTGYYDLSPSLLGVVRALQDAGCAVAWMQVAGEPGKAARLQADDPRDEIKRVGAWARSVLQQHPTTRIGIVVPDLQARRAAWEHALRRDLDPASLLPGAPVATRPWNLSLGQALAEYPVVATALRLLRLTSPTAEASLLGQLLLSPHWALPREPAQRRGELERRALLDRRIRSTGDARLGLSTVRFHAGGGRDEAEPQAWHSDRLAKRLKKLQRAARELPTRAGAADWASVFAAWLKTAGWNGSGDAGRPLDSHEFQAVEAWNELLSRFSGLDDFAGTLGCDEALSGIERLAAETPFQPRSEDTAVQVLGLYEAIGQSFDRLWVTGLHDGVWPPPPGPDPFIPIAIQRERGLPHCGPEVQLEWSRRVTGQLRRAAPEVIFSFPGRDGDERLYCSPLIAALPVLEAAELPAPDRGDWPDQVRRSGAAESVPDQAALPFTGHRVRGGSRVFADQAACAFKAFAAHRLGAEALERPQAGLNPMRRGTLVHRLLASLWTELESRENLLALDESRLRECLRAHIEVLLETERRRSPATFTARFRAVEARRLEDRAVAWLEVERQRSPFRVVSTEQETAFEIGGLALKIYLDRVDELADGSRAVLDYKTGKVTPSAWFGERPEEPQLPLYGVALREALGREAGAPGVAAVAFAQVQPDKTGFSGVVREAGLLPGLPGTRKGPVKEAAENWPAVLDEWSAELERLAGHFRAGTAEVDPKRGLATCDRTYCSLGPLCRVRESLPAAGGSDDNSAGDDDGR